MLLFDKSRTLILEWCNELPEMKESHGSGIVLRELILRLSAFRNVQELPCSLDPMKLVVLSANSMMLL